MSLRGAPVTAESRIAAPVFSGMRGSKNAIEGIATGVFTPPSLSRTRGDRSPLAILYGAATRRNVMFDTYRELPHNWGYRVWGQIFTV